MGYVEMVVNTRFLGWGLALALLTGGSVVHAQEAPGTRQAVLKPLPQIQYVVKGQDFQVLQPAQRSTPGRTELVVFFWYGSPWVAQVEPYLRNWVEQGRAPANLRIQFVPLLTNQNESWAFSARIFFALEQLRVERQITPKLLRAVQEKVVDLSSPKSVNTWLVHQGVDGKAFQEAINSPMVIARVSSLPSVARNYQAKSTPTFVIDGTYQIAATEKMPPERATAVAIFMATKLSEGGPRP